MSLSQAWHTLDVAPDKGDRDVLNEIFDVSDRPTWLHFEGEQHYDDTRGNNVYSQVERSVGRNKVEILVGLWEHCMASGRLVDFLGGWLVGWFEQLFNLRQLQQNIDASLNSKHCWSFFGNNILRNVYVLI